MSETVDTVKVLGSTSLPVGTLYLRSDNIVVIDMSDSFETGIDAAIESSKISREFRKGVRFPCLYVQKSGGVATKEVRDYMASKERLEDMQAAAFVISSVAQKLVGNLYLKINRPHVPTRMFNDFDDAVKWLRNYVD